MPEEWLALNRALWDERVPIHVASDFYDVDAFLAGALDAARRSSWRRWATSRGLTLAARAVPLRPGHALLGAPRRARDRARLLRPRDRGRAQARRRRRLEAEFVASDVYDAAEALGGRRFDLVYTGLGALNWLPDVERWARVMASLVAPGGRFYLAEFHPFSAVFAEDALTVKYPYFHSRALQWDEPGTYADPEAETEHNRSVEWNHGLGSVVSALVAAGLRVEFLHEHDSTLFARLAVPGAGRGRHLPAAGGHAVAAAHVLGAGDYDLSAAGSSAGFA